jgi:hypothetical protein
MSHMTVYCDFVRKPPGMLRCTLCHRTVLDRKIGKQLCTALPDLDYEQHLRDCTQCSHRGDVVGRTGCFGCGNARVVALYKCEVHGTCTVIKKPKEVCCPCEERSQ